MKQVIQNFKTGKLHVDEVPPPSISKGFVLVKNRFSLISAGTERGTVKVAKASLIGKAKQRPDLVAQVIQNIRKEGFKATLNKVQTKLDSLKALGYSSAGEVIASMDDNLQFQKGDRVACAGQDYASHAELVAIPQNLIVKIPQNVTYEQASFTTLGAIAMQGIRQADPKLGEVVCVIGLGLLGQLTCQLLKANGCKVFAIDFSDHLTRLAEQSGADAAMNRNSNDLKAVAEHFTNGFGFDSVIVTAATSSNDPVELAAELLRKKGKLVIVGAVKMDIPRDPHFYRKELELKMSCSYGPGRYDVNYEEYGQDYPFPYVRWTEQRNMAAFLQLVSQGKLNLDPLITHVYNIDEAEQAYDLVLGKIKEPHIAILLNYPERENMGAASVTVSQAPVSHIQCGFIGAGSFAQSYLIPHVKDFGAGLETVVTSRGITSKNVAEKFGFQKASTDISEVIASPSINTVFIATPHNTHADYVLQSLKAGKNVFVEKPLALNQEELDQINQYCNNSGKQVMVGFNRRFSPLAVKFKSLFANVADSLVIQYRVNAGFIPKEHWSQSDLLGGGRIIGEICHFIDLMQFFTGALPLTVYAQSLHTGNKMMKNDDNLIINISFSNGSIGSIVYVANGDKALPKEKIEIFGGGMCAVINDFKTGEWYAGNSKKEFKLPGKGHQQEVQAFLLAVNSGSAYPISFESIYHTTKASFKVLDSLYTALPQHLN